MKARVDFAVGKARYELEIEEPKEIDTLHKAIVLGNPPQYCQVCKNTDLFRLDTNKDKDGNTYINIVCKCGAKAKLGQYKSSGYFWHRFELYQPKEDL